VLTLDEDDLDVSTLRSDGDGNLVSRPTPGSRVEYTNLIYVEKHHATPFVAQGDGSPEDVVV